ncbi:MAG: hypothetical protein AAB458_00530 [Patescibacteria group bacterium]
MIQRLITTLILALAVYFVPWWLVVAGLVAALMSFPRYLEVVFVALLFDLTYGGTIFGISGFFTLATALVYLIYTYMLVPRLRHDVFQTS